MNKNGQMGVGVIVLLVLIFGGVVWFGVSNSQDPADAAEDKTITGDCSTDPIISLTYLDTFNTGSQVSTVTAEAMVNGEYIGSITSGTTKFSFGDEVILFMSKSGYIDTVSETISVKCGENKVIQKLSPTSAATFRLFNTDNSRITDAAAGGAINQSASANPINMQVCLDSVTDEATGTLTIVVEAGNTTQVDSIRLSFDGVSDTTIPEFHTDEAGTSLSISDAWTIPALSDGESKCGTLTISPEAGETIDGTAVYVTAYAEQAFVETDGSFAVGVENDRGTAKYEWTTDHDLLIA